MKQEFRASAALQKRFGRRVTLALGLGSVCLFGSGYFFYQGREVVTPIGLMLLGLLQLLWAGVAAATTQAVKLVLTPAHLVLSEPGLELTTTWDNVVRIDRVRMLWATYDCLVLRAPAQQKMAWWFNLFRPLPEATIPLPLFADWRETELGPALRQYAPHLF